SLRKNIVAMYALQIANYVIPLLTLPYLIRVLGAEQYGVMAMAYAVVYFMVLFVDAGFNTIATRRLARPGIDIESISETYATTQFIKLLQSAMMFALLCVLVTNVPKFSAASAIYYASFPIVIGSLLFPTWLFQGLEIMHFTTVCSVGGRLLATIGIFVFVRDSGDVVTAAFLQASATALSGLLALPFILGRLRLRFTMSWRRLVKSARRTLDEARMLAPAEYVTDAISNSNVFVLGLFAGDAAVGVYAAIEKIARACASLFQPLTKALFPSLAGRWLSATHDAELRSRHWTRIILLLALLASMVMLAAAPFALELLFGAGWAEHAALLRVLAAWIVANVTAVVLGQFWLLARGRKSVYARGLFFAGALQLFASVTGAWLFGVTGIVVAAVIAEILRVIIFLHAARRNGPRVPSCVS
ncbi:MAG: oligosaccharide flippase family protein, partial [Gammaproteobacteria bacterium]|nr:oligosaccharide flippase family protein [Gammaproteobacteria bacterium]